MSTGSSKTVEKAKVIYVSDAHRFIPNEFLPELRANELVLRSMKANYQLLRKHVNLPERVCVVSHPTSVKMMFNTDRASLEEDSGTKVTTTYLTLEILERMIGAKAELDTASDPVLREYVYRRIGALLCDSSIALDDSIRQRLIFLPNVPMARQVATDFRLSSATFEEGTPDTEPFRRKVQKTLTDVSKFLEETFSWKALEDVYKIVQERFAANKVSRDFPLSFQPPGWFIPQLYEVSLVEGIDIAHGYEEILGYLRVGCSASGETQVPVDIVADLDKLYKKDKFGITKRAHSLPRLISELPSPKTIITDTYIADYFPDLKFEAQQVRMADLTDTTAIS